MINLLRLTKGRLLMEVPSLPMLDQLILDKYLRALPYEMKKTVSMQNPKSLEELLTVVEIHQNTRNPQLWDNPDGELRHLLLGAHRVGPSGRVRQHGDPGPPAVAHMRGEGGTRGRGGDSVLCTRGHEEVPNCAREDNHPKGGVPDARGSCS
jgi:hypothetical protein